MYLWVVQIPMHRKILKLFLAKKKKKKINDKICITFKETFSNTNLDSVSELSPNVQRYNKEIIKFVHEFNIKNSILLDYTVLEISEVPHWAETFQVLARSNVQQEVQPMQVPTPNF